MATKKITIEKIYNIFKKYGDLDIAVKTPYGFKRIEACDITAKNSDVIKTTLRSGKTIETSPKHKLKTKNGRFKDVIALKTGQFVKTVDGDDEIVSFELLPNKKDLYDIQVADVKQYYSNGIVSHNSSIMDALAFCVFDKFSKGYKASHVLNTQKMTFKCKFNFDVNGVDYFIEREGKSDKKGNVKVDVKFYKIDKDGNEVPLNGEARRSTNDIIRDYVGTYDDFILTVLSIQNNKAGSFIDLGQTERKDLLCQFMGLTLFDQLYTISNDNFKETNTLLKNISKDQLVTQLEEISCSIKSNNNTIIECGNKIQELESKKEEYNIQLLDLSKNIIKTDSFDLDISKLETKRIDIDHKITKTKSDVDTYKIKLSDVDVKLNQLSSSLSDYEDIESKYEEYKQLKTKESEKSRELDTIKLVVKNKMEKLKKLEDHKYDPNCTYCINNVFVKDAIKTKEELEIDKNKVKAILDEFNLIRTELDKFGDIESIYKNCVKFNNDKSMLEKNKSSINNSILSLENVLMNLTNESNGVASKIEEFFKNKDIIENNKKLMVDIDKYKQLIKGVEVEIKNQNNKLFTSSTQKGTLDFQYKNVTAQLNKVKELEDSYESYKLYTDIISRDGIPYEIITKTLPEIEKEVNNILHQIVEFTIALQTDGKNITTTIVYDDKKWPLEMASGMEKFISGLAMRVALINISNLPRPNIICIDEGFGCADSDHLGQMGSLFNYLKSQFDFIWIISHLDQMRDMVDSQIEIKKENGYSKVIYK